VFLRGIEMILRRDYAFKAAILKIASVLLGIKAFTYARSNNYWLEMSLSQIPYSDRKHYFPDYCPAYAEDKEPGKKTI
jgi:hypothetical protein